MGVDHEALDHVRRGHHRGDGRTGPGHRKRLSGAGSGARLGGRFTAFNISWRTVAAARLNAPLTGQTVRVRHGDLTAAVPGPPVRPGDREPELVTEEQAAASVLHGDDPDARRGPDLVRRRGIRHCVRQPDRQGAAGLLRLLPHGDPAAAARLSLRPITPGPLRRCHSWISRARDDRARGGRGVLPWRGSASGAR